MILPERLMKLRKAAGLSQEEVADKLEVTRQTVSKWETGQSSPDLDKVLPLCDLYGVTPDELLHEGGSQEAEQAKAESDVIRSEELVERITAKKKLRGILCGVMLYFVAIAFIMVAIPVLRINSVVSSAVFILLFAIATLVIIYSSIVYKKKKKTHNVTREEKLYKNIDSIIAFTTLAVYLIVSFLTMAWHITWILWVVYAILSQIAKLVIMLATGKDVDEE